MSSWLKMESSTPEKPEVLAITVKMGWDDPDLTVGKLFRVWNWFDQHTVDGNAQSVTAALLDRIVGVTGFINAMASVGWLVIHEDGISLPNFDRHNGATAKKRALTAKRVANHKSSLPKDQESNDQSVSSALPRIDKNREDKNNKNNKNKEKINKKEIPEKQKTKITHQDLIEEGIDPQQALEHIAVRKEKKQPMTPTAWAMMKREADKLGWTIQEVVKRCNEQGWASFRAQWILNQEDGLTAGGSPTLNKQEALEQRNAKIAQEWASDEVVDI